MKCCDPTSSEWVTRPAWSVLSFPNKWGIHWLFWTVTIKNNRRFSSWSHFKKERKKNSNSHLSKTRARVGVAVGVGGDGWLTFAKPFSDSDVQEYTRVFFRQGLTLLTSMPLTKTACLERGKARWPAVPKRKRKEKQEKKRKNREKWQPTGEYVPTSKY